jgi:hypothetical protein
LYAWRSCGLKSKAVLAMFRNRFKNIWDKEQFQLVKGFFIERIHHFNDIINDESGVFAIQTLQGQFVPGHLEGILYASCQE